MPDPEAERPMHTLVRAVFRTSAAFFEMPRIATFGDLADRLCHLGERYDSPLVSADIRDTPPGDGPSIRAAMLHLLAADDEEPSGAELR